MIDAELLLSDGQKLVKSLVEDFRRQAASDEDAASFVENQYESARRAGRTALSKSDWSEGLFAQAAVAWFLGGVFVRFCEDNALVAESLLSGVGQRRSVALDHRSAYLAEHPDRDDRHWLRHIFSQYRSLPATGDIFGEHNPLWLLSLSADGARELRELFQRIDPDSGELRHDFGDQSLSTRFLGDLYQSLSEHAQKFYALLQTPVFVEEFILDRTLEPAITTFGLAQTTIIDPTCGSGHFLLGAFARLFAHWSEAEPGVGRRELVRRSLDAIGGVDLNPFAAAIARFRLLVAALQAGGGGRLADLPAYPIHVAVGDSLLHGDPPGRLAGTLLHHEGMAASLHGYATEDVEATRELLSRSWSAVVGNPPYITVKDPALNQLYRDRFKTCSGKYSLGVPFTERFWQLAQSDPRQAERAGYVGMITANSFMKREMGKKLVEDWFPHHDVTHVIDTSGAYIPGHGIPTAILFGRSRSPVEKALRAVMGIRGEPSTPDVPEKGLVWSSIVKLVDQPGFGSQFVSVVDLSRDRLRHHPWSIGGGGAAELKDWLDARAALRLGAIVDSIGITAVTGEDDLYFIGDRATVARRRVAPCMPLTIGEKVRDWKIDRLELAAWTYDNSLIPRLAPSIERYLWVGRTRLSRRKRFGTPMLQCGLTWWEWQELYQKKLAIPLTITFANVATHNHFVLDRGGKVFNRTAPVIKLPAGTDEARYLELLGALNSSTACFWMQQVFFNKGGPGGGSSKDEKWHDFYAHDGIKLQSFPLPPRLDGATATLLDRLAQDLQAVTPASLVATGAPTAARLAEGERDYHRLRAEMIAAEERLDWESYRWYGLLDEDLTTGTEPEPPLALGERAFEIVLARRLASGEDDTKWFSWLWIEPITELPAHWPEQYRRLVERRIDVIESDPNIALIERQETKRRWEAEPWEDQRDEALRAWLCDRLEVPRYWPEPAAITTCARLAALARADAEFMEVARLYRGDEVDGAALVSELVAAESVPYLAAYRYSESGLRKHAEWLKTWECQRRDDAGEDVGEIPVPPKYAKADFKGRSWEHRGKLDVPKERFISYPGAEREADPSAVVGWAGWDHLARARALAVWYGEARRDGRQPEQLKPLLAGLLELVPWLKQWYDEPSSDPALDRPGSQIASFVEAELRGLGLSKDAVTSWVDHPEAPRRGRRAR